MKTIGILGGMGPSATAGLYQRILRLCQIQHGAVQDKDYPGIIIYSMSLKGSDESGIADRNTLLNELIAGVVRLTAAGCDFIVLPSNTAHIFISELKEHSVVPIISMIDKTVQMVAMNSVRCIGLLASEDSYHYEIYVNALAKNGIKLVIPSEIEQKGITRIILHVMGGEVHNNVDWDTLYSIIKHMEQMGAEAVIIGCTELSLVISAKEYPLKVYDSLDLLAKAAVEMAYG
jgi:aspartate racemase